MDEFLIIEPDRPVRAAAADASAKVMGLAYSGGKMSLPGWRHPVVVDLSGMEIPESVPLLTNHENRTGSRVGVVQAKVEGDGLVIDGEILSSSGQAQGIVEQARAGADWQLSIGAEVLESELVRTRRMVNGRMQTGPFYHVRKSVLREVSVVAVGADMSTRMRVAASFNLYGGKTMEFEQWLKEHDIEAEGMDEERTAALREAFGAGEEPPVEVVAGAQPDGGPAPEPENQPDEKKVRAAGRPAARRPASDLPGDAGQGRTVAAVAAGACTPPGVQARQEAERAINAERDRVSAIQDICAGEFPEIEREAIRAGWDIDRTSQRVLKAVREARPQADLGISAGRDRGRDHEVGVLEAALCLRAGIPSDQITSDYGQDVMRSVRGERDLSLQMVFAECARLEGVSLPRSFSNETIRAAFSTVSLPGILNNVANKQLLRSFQAQPVIATRLCSEGELNDFKESERYRLTDVGDLLPVAQDGELKHGGLTEEKATNQLGTFGKIFSLTRQMIYNDDLGAFLKVPTGMGARAARKIDQLFFTRLLANPSSLFSTGHGNYKEGADTALGITSLGEAVQMFLDQTDADGQPINVSPKYLLVPTALKMTARELLSSTLLIAVGGTDRDRIPTYNAVADEDLELVVSPYLSNENYTGASAAAWYLFADPAIVDTFEIGYLKGRRTPTVEQGETDFNTLGMQFRVYFDLGVREQDYRGMVKFKGEA